MTTPNEIHTTPDACERRIVRAGFQGREGSFGARAAARCGCPVPLDTFDALLAALAAGEIDEALLPAVDRVIGPVDEALSALVRALDGGLAVAVLAEVEVPMRLVLAAPRGTLDLGGLLAARQLTHLPLLADPSHASGRRELVPGLARAASDAGVDGLIIEVHDAPESAWCDGPQALLPEDLERLCDDFGLLPGATPSIERVRTAIDSVDREIGRLVVRRLELCRRVASAKRAAGVPLRDAAREESVTARYLETPGMDEASARRLAESLISMGLTVEGWTAEGAA